MHYFDVLFVVIFGILNEDGGQATCVELTIPVFASLRVLNASWFFK
jgi:hypothetical protein